MDEFIGGGIDVGVGGSMSGGVDAGVQLRLFATDNPTLEEGFSAFCQVYMPGRNFTAATRRGYRYDLAEWIGSLQVTQVKAISTLAIQPYLSQLDAQGLQGSTRQRKIAAIKTFLRFLEEQGVLPKDFSSILVWPRRRSTTIKPCSVHGDTQGSSD